LVTQVCDILGITITQDNLLHPARDLNTTKMIYFAILREVGLADKMESNSAWNSGYRLHPNMPSDIEVYPEVFQDTMFEDKVVGTLRRFYRDIQHDDPVEFGLGELISPDSKRHRRFISTFLNYWHFNTSTYDDMTGAREAVEGEARDMRAMEEDVKKLGEQVTRLRKSQSEDKMRAESLREKEKQNLHKIAQHNEGKERLEEEKVELKAALKGAESSSEELEKELAAMDAKCKMLNMLLNGDDINAKLAEQLEQLEAAENAQRAVEPALAGKYDYANEQNTDIAAVMRLLEVVSTVMAEVKALEGTNKSTSWELSSAQKQAEEADKNLMYARQRMRDVKASEAEARTKWGRKQEEKEVELARFTTELGGVERRDDEGAVSGTRERLAAIEDEDRASSAEFERLMSLYENLYLKLMEKAKEWNDKIQSRILEICEARQELKDL